MIQVLQLGLIDYDTALRLQQSLVELRKQGAIADTLLLLEHPPVITLGRNAKAANILASAELLKQKGVEIFECDRGGDVTFHGPGQLVGYPIFDLRAFTDAQGDRKTLGAVEYVRKLEEVLIRTCGDLGIPATRIAGLTGVWTEENPPQRHPSTSLGTGSDTETEERKRPPRSRGDAEEIESKKLKGLHAAGAKSIERSSPKKLAAIGVHISRGVTSHGFALNVNNDLEFFNLIVPCGITEKTVTSMENELHATGSPVPKMEDVAHAVTRNFGRVFQRQIVWLLSLDDLMGSSKPAPQDTPAKPPKELRELHGDEIFLA